MKSICSTCGKLKDMIEKESRFKYKVCDECKGLGIDFNNNIKNVGHSIEIDNGEEELDGEEKSE